MFSNSLKMIKTGRNTSEFTFFKHFFTQLWTDRSVSQPIQRLNSHKRRIDIHCSAYIQDSCPKNWHSNPGRGQDYCHLHCVQTDFGSHQASREISMMIKLPGREASQPWSSAELRMLSPSLYRPTQNHRDTEYIKFMLSNITCMAQCSGTKSNETCSAGTSLCTWTRTPVL